MSHLKYLSMRWNLWGEGGEGGVGQVRGCVVGGGMEGWVGMGG